MNLNLGPKGKFGFRAKVCGQHQKGCIYIVSLGKNHGKNTNFEKGHLDCWFLEVKLMGNW